MIATGPFAVIGVVVFVAAISGAYTYGHKNATNACKAAQLAAVEKEHARYVKKSEQLARSAAALAKLRRERGQKSEQIEREVERIVERPVYRNVCFDADGLRIVNDAIADRPPDPARTVDTVPSTAPAYEWVK
jgi:hydroxylamine reductase (hybrid-cluster protein)